MLTIDLSSLSATELRRLLEAAEARGQAELAERLRAQLEAGGRSAGWRPPAPAPTLAHAAQAWLDDDPEPAPRRPIPWARAALFVAVAGLGTLVASVDLGRPPVQAAPPAAPSPAPPPRLAVALTVPALPPAPEAEPPAAPAPQPQRVATARPKAARPAPARKANPCYDEPTPADRLICGYPALAIQDRTLHEAYDRAIRAGADPAAVERDQRTWKSARDGISDRFALADHYQARIRELDAAAARAEALTPPF